jgi:hypothetical protein
MDTRIGILGLLDGSAASRELDLVSALFHRINRVMPPDQQLFIVWL